VKKQHPIYLEFSNNRP